MTLSRGGITRILVVDDEAMVRALLAEVLTKSGYEITTAEDGACAVDALGQVSFDVVVTDLVMPGLDGIQVLREVKRKDAATPVIIITGYPSEESAIKLIRLGATDYISKPFNVDTVKITIAKALELRRQSAASSPRELPVDIETGTIAGLHDQRTFADILKSEIERSDWKGHVFSLLVLRIEQLHTLVAHKDRILRETVQRLHEVSRPGDTAGRTGPEEFGMVLPETGREEAEMLRQKVLAGAVLMTLSGSAACFPADGTDSETLLKKARSVAQALTY